MTVVSHVIESGSIQLDGRRALVERYTRHDGTVAFFCSLVAAAQDLVAWAAARIARIEADDVTAEIGANIQAIASLGSLAAPTMVFSTLAQNVAALRIRYASATRVEAIMMGDYLAARSDAVLRNAFGITQAQVDNLRTNKLTPAAALAADIRVATGA